jgi:hypothetical protein
MMYARVVDPDNSSSQFSFVNLRNQFKSPDGSVVVNDLSNASDVYKSYFNVFPVQYTNDAPTASSYHSVDVTYLWSPIDRVLFATYVLSPVALVEAKATKRAELDAALQAALVAGVSFDGNTFPSDSTAVTYVTGIQAALTAGLINQAMYFKDVNGTPVLLSLERLSAFCATYLSHVLTCHEMHRVALDALSAASSVGEVIDVSY